MRTCLMTQVCSRAGETSWFDISLCKFINLRKTLIFLPSNKWLASGTLLESMRSTLYQGHDPSHFLPLHGRAGPSALRRKNTQFVCYSRNSELCGQLNQFKDPSRRHICCQCLHVRNFCLHNFALKDDGMKPTLIKYIGNTNLLWKAPLIHLLVAKVYS